MLPVKEDEPNVMELECSDNSGKEFCNRQQAKDGEVFLSAGTTIGARHSSVCKTITIPIYWWACNKEEV